MKLTVDNKDYVLDTKRAVELGVLVEEVKEPHTIKLSDAEVETLLRIVDSIGGCAFSTPRKHTNSISKKLKTLSFKSSDQSVKFRLESYTHKETSLYFKPNGN